MSIKSYAKHALLLGAWTVSGNGLAGQGCVDPDLAGVASSVTLTLCDGTLAKGKLDLTQLKPEHIAGGVTIAGVSGTAPLTLAPCAQDGAVNCLATPAFKAAKKSFLVPHHIKIGVTIGDVAGSYDPSSVTCSSNGEVNCLTTATYQAADLSNLVPAKIKNGVTVAGVSGVYPSSSARLGGATATADLTSLDATTPAGTYEFFDSVGAHYSGVLASVGTVTPGATPQTFNSSLYRGFSVAGDADLNSANIKDGTTIFSVSGALTAAPTTCSGNGETGCVTTSAYQAADLSNLNPSRIKNGVTVAGVAGEYPSATYPLAGASATADLTSFTAANGGTTYEWFHADGTRLSGTVENDAHVDPSTSNQTLDDGLYRSITVAGDPDLLAANIRNGVSIFGVTGNVVASAANCTADGQTACVVTGSFKAAEAARLLAENIKDGVTLGGVAGNITGAPANCTSTNQVGCVTTATYKAADLSNLNAGNIKAGVTIAGVLGTYPSAATPLTSNTGATDLTSLDASTTAGSYEFFDSVGTRYPGTIADAGTITVGTANQTFNAGAYRGFTVPGDAGLTAGNIRTGTVIFGVTGTLTPSPATCSSDSQTSCVTDAVYKAANTAGFASSDVKVGKTVAGVAGTLADCAADGGSACVVDGTNYKAAKLSNFVAADVKTGVTVAGVAGSATMESHTPCASDGGVGCLTTANYPAANSSNATVDNIKSGVVLAGVTGQFPSATYSLSGASATADLENATFNTQVKSATAFEYWDSAGAKHTGTGDANIVAAKIKNGTTIFSTGGSAVVESHSACASDGASGCYTDGTNYKAAKLSNFTAADIKSGVTIAAVAGSSALESHSNCASNGAGNCYVDGTTYKAASTAAAVAGNIRSGVSLAGATGQYPSASYPLVGADATEDLDSATFNAKIKSATAFEWFDANGTRHTGAGDADISEEKIAKGISIFGTVGSYDGICGDPGNSCYDNASLIAAGVAITPSGKNLTYVLASGSFYVWKDVGSNKILRANGLDEWAMKLNLSGKGLRSAGNEFTDYTIIEGRKCPPNVYIDDTDKASTNNCLYYSVGYPTQARNAAGTSQTTASQIGLNNWNNYNGGEARWYVGNVKTCSDKGMRIPTMFESATTMTTHAYYPNSDGTPVFAESNGIPNYSWFTMTATARTDNTGTYWVWLTGAGSGPYDSSINVRCVLP